MKTKLQIIGIALLGFILTSCSSSMYMSKTSASSTDDIYYTPSKTKPLVSDVDAKNIVKDDFQNQSSQDFDQLERKYSPVASADTIYGDTLSRKLNNSNPFERIVSDSYQDSYERRLRGMEDPHYGMENFTTRFSNDYWYASTYDPYFYNIVVMGNQVWVEPRYISSMFSWPQNNFWLGVGLGFGINSWYSNYYSPYYGYNNWYGWDPYYWNSNYYTNVNFNNNNYYYGRRSDLASSSLTPNLRTRNSYENQFISSHRRSGITDGTGTRNGDIRTRNTNQTNITGGRDGNQEVIVRGNRNSDINTTRLRGEATTRNINSTEPTRRNNNYQTPRSTTSDRYIRTGTRNQNNEATTRGNNSRNTTTTRETRNTSPTYNRPSRVESSNDKQRTTSTNNTNRESTVSRGSSSNASSGTNSNSGSSSNSQNSSSSSSRERRR